MFDYRGFILVGLFFGGAAISCLTDIGSGLINHGDASHEFTHQKPTLTHSRNSNDAGYYRGRQLKFRDKTPAIENKPRTRQNPFSQ